MSSTQTENSPNLNRLREVTTQLKALLDDPHPGLFTWTEMFFRKATELKALLGAYIK